MAREVFDAGVLVIGGGISGLTTAIEAAEVGHKVILVEKEPFLGGKVARNNKYYTKLCPPSCGLEINFKRIKRNPLIRCTTQVFVVCACILQSSGTCSPDHIDAWICRMAGAPDADQRLEQAGG